MKKISLLLILLFCWNVYAAWGYDVKVDGIYYNLDSDNHTASVTFDGKDLNTSSDTRYTKNVVVPKEISVNGIKYAVTSLGKSCFSHCERLTSITIPESVTSLGNGCFYGCTRLTSITIPESVTSLENYCFYDCTGLTAITIPESVTSLGNYCFSGCKRLTAITLPNSVTNIGEYCFKGCSALPSITIPNTLTILGDYCFSGWDGLTTITIPSSVTSLGNYCFYRCEGLTSITIPESVTSLGNDCFEGCKGLTSITIPESVTSLGDHCFLDCKGLTSITIPSSVTSLEDGCFWGCKGLTSITIPSSVTSLGDECFSGCTGLTSITIPESVTSLGNSCFEGCTGLTSITIPESVTSLGYACFRDCTRLTSITIPSSVTWLGDYCFWGCTGLISLIIPNSDLSFGITGNNNCFGGASYKIYSHPKYYIHLEYYYKERVGLYGSPLYKFDSIDKTQTTLSLQFVPCTDVDYMLAEDSVDFHAIEKTIYVWAKDSVSLPITSNQHVVWKDLAPNTSYEVYGYVKYSDGCEAWIGYADIKTLGVNPSISTKAASPTMVTYTARFTPGDAHVKEVIVNGETVDPSQITQDGDKYVVTMYETGLQPKSVYKGSIKVKTEEGSTETAEATITTPALELTTLQPKCVSSSCAIVAATTNIAEEEMNVGFQWKKYDAPESLAPNEAYAAIYDGQLEGYLRNLQSTSYYNVRAFYKAKTGDYYYGDWVTFDPSDFSYFEPTVHTYPVTKTTDCTASVRGYVLAGTDNITEQGFEYWETSGPATAARMTKSVLPAADKSVVLATGQVMQVVLDGLKPQTTYTYRAFVRTAGGTTYGEEQTFTTEVPTGIGAVQADKATPQVTGYYDLSGRRLTGKQRGVVIERYADGTSRKVLVK